ncbi:MAG TPA: sigma-54 dependent transcriptional regulator [Candidatus Tectomicrobia bacterium]|nr:sigma-54 dependent transcriptional regulator [Candidatus Tectomicrobia bacterium]
MADERILVVDDEESIRWVLTRGLARRGWKVQSAENAHLALRRLAEQDYALVFLDVRLPDIDGLTLLEQIRALANPPMVVVMTAQGTVDTAINAMKKGAYEYIIKPFDLEDVVTLAHQALRTRAAVADVTIPVPLDLRDSLHASGIIGRTEQMQQVYKMIGMVADRDVTVLIEGESGTGKELIARAIHRHSKRAKRPFVTVNCAAIPHELLESELFGHEKGSFTGATATTIGKFQQADGGTMFLDEVGDMDLNLQAKLLRVLQEKEFYRVGGRDSIRVDVRIIAATHQNLEVAVTQKRFREDLYYRLNVVPVYLPPLRERRDDIPLLIDYFLQRFEADLGTGRKFLSNEARDILLTYHWAGNIRELENVIKRAMVLTTSSVILPPHLPEAIRGGIKGEDESDTLRRLVERKARALLLDVQAAGTGEIYHMILGEVERLLLQVVLDETDGNQLRTADLLGINRNTLRKKVRTLGVEVRRVSKSEPTSQASLQQ